MSVDEKFLDDQEPQEPEASTSPFLLEEDYETVADVPAPPPHDEDTPGRKEDLLAWFHTVKRTALGTTSRGRLFRLVGALTVVAVVSGALIATHRQEPLISPLGTLDSASALEALQDAEDWAVENAEAGEILLPSDPAEHHAFFVQGGDGTLSTRVLIGAVREEGTEVGSYLEAAVTFSASEEGKKIETTFIAPETLLTGSLGVGETLRRPDGVQPLSSSSMDLIPPVVKEKIVEKIVYKEGKVETRVIPASKAPAKKDSVTVPVKEVSVGDSEVEVEKTKAVDTPTGVVGPENERAFIYRVGINVGTSGVEFEPTEGEEEEVVTTLPNDASSANDASSEVEPAARVLLNSETVVEVPSTPGKYEAFILLDPSKDSLSIEVTTSEGDVSEEPLVGLPTEPIYEPGNVVNSEDEGVIKLVATAGDVGTIETDDPLGINFNANVHAVKVGKEIGEPGTREVTLFLRDNYFSPGLRVETAALPGSSKDDWTGTVLRDENGTEYPLVSTTTTQFISDGQRYASHEATGDLTNTLTFRIPASLKKFTLVPTVEVSGTRVFLDWERVYSPQWHETYRTESPADPSAYAGMNTQAWSHRFDPAVLGVVSVDLTVKVNAPEEAGDEDQPMDEHSAQDEEVMEEAFGSDF